MKAATTVEINTICGYTRAKFIIDFRSDQHTSPKCLVNSLMLKDKLWFLVKSKNKISGNHIYLKVLH